MIFQLTSVFKILPLAGIGTSSATAKNRLTSIWKHGSIGMNSQVIGIYFLLAVYIFCGVNGALQSSPQKEVRLRDQDCWIHQFVVTSLHLFLILKL